MTHLWRGYHRPDLVELLRSSWFKKDLVILIPPSTTDFSFLGLFDPQQIAFHGDWTTYPTLPKTLPQSEHLEKLKQARIAVFTSGTGSGIPKLIFYSEENIMASLQAIRELFEVSRIKNIFSYPQPTHVFGIVLGYLQAILNDIQIHFSEGPYSKKAHDQWLSVVDENTLTLGTPTHFIDLIQKVKAEGLTPQKSYSAIIGGARATLKLWHQLRDVLNIQSPSIGYGASEASPGLTHLPPGIEPKDDGDIGFVLSQVHLSTHPEGVRFSGPNLCLAIFENNELTERDEILISDCLIQDKNSQIARYSFIGRTDLLINRGGIKFSLEIIEAKIASHFACRCLAISVFDERLGEDIGILVQSDQVSLSQQNLQDFLIEEFGLKISTNNILLCEIPLNPNGKFDRKTSLIRLLKQRSWTFPISVEYLIAFLPHRRPAIWIDSILETKFDYGVAEVILNKRANYFSGDHLRESACIEWVAQAYGYTAALNDILGIKNVKQVTRGFIAEVKNSKFFFDEHKIKFLEGEKLKIEAHCTHEFGQIAVVQGKVFYKELLLASIGMKLYRG